MTPGKVICNAVVRTCCRCRFLRKRFIEVPIAPLKAHRLRGSQCFQTVAVDLCGPYLTKSDKRTTRANNTISGKVWVLAVVCSASQAVHIEAVQGYDTNNFLAALDNFVAIRGKPTHIIADRGSQVMSASNTVSALWNEIDTTRLQNQMCESTTWEFVPSGAHSFLGMAERVIGTFKKTMEAMTYT